MDVHANPNSAVYNGLCATPHASHHVPSFSGETRLLDQLVLFWSLSFYSCFSVQSVVIFEFQC